MINVLIIEDDPMVAHINNTYVNSVDGFKVVGIAKNYTEAISFIKKQEVNLLLLDIYLPKGDGISILREIRGKQIECDVIMVTASSEIDKIDEAFKYGVVDYLIKPFEYERLKMSLINYQSRHSTLSGDKEITQSDIDREFVSRVNLEDDRIPKGLNNLTLNRISRILEEKKSFVRIDEISDEIGLTNVTVRKYMDYLEKIGYVIKEIEYGSVGRPSFLYKNTNRN